jgi:tRNA nucleotidyltransferase (CCA-adding enzyme)
MSLKGIHIERVHIPEKMHINLTPEEDQLCNLLDECTLALKEKESITTSCRVAGGWVRDKVCILH